MNLKDIALQTRICEDRMTKNYLVNNWYTVVKVASDYVKARDLLSAIVAEDLATIQKIIKNAL